MTLDPKVLAQQIKVNEDSLRQTYPPDVNIARSIVFHYLMAEAKAGRRLMPREASAEMHSAFVVVAVEQYAHRNLSWSFCRDAYAAMFDAASQDSPEQKNNPQQGGGAA